MTAVGDMPVDFDSDDEREEENESEDEEEDEEDGEGEGEEYDTAATNNGAEKPETLDEAAFQSQMSARLEAIRLSKALGNDDPDELEQESEEESEESESESESDGSDTQSIAAQTDYTTYQRAPRPHKQRLEQKKLGQRDIVKQAVEAEIRAKGGVAGRASGGSGASKVGKAKGHKWKASSKYLVGKDSGW
jgi:RIO kinase 2